MRDDKKRRSLSSLTEQKESGENLYLAGYRFASTCLGFPNWRTWRQASLHAKEKNELTFLLPSSVSLSSPAISFSRFCKIGNWKSFWYTTVKRLNFDKILRGAFRPRPSQSVFTTMCIHIVAPHVRKCSRAHIFFTHSFRMIFSIAYTRTKKYRWWIHRTQYEGFSSFR